MQEILLNVQHAGQPIPNEYFIGDVEQYQHAMKAGMFSALQNLVLGIYLAYRRKSSVGGMSPSYYRAKAKKVRSLKVQCTKVLTILQELGAEDSESLKDLQSRAPDTKYREKTLGLLSSFVHLANVMRSTIPQTDSIIIDLEERANRSDRADKDGTEEGDFVLILEEVFRANIVRDPAWIRKPRFNKSQGADPFSVFVASIVRAKGGQMSDESAQRIVRETLKVAARTSLEK
jgi:hypothetical protein